jgi:hypothetical protein
MRSTSKPILLSALALVLGAGFARAEEWAAKKKSLPLLVPHEKFSQDCGQCHVAKNWTTMRRDFHFDHAKETGFPLNGAHAAVKCTQCHTDRGSVKQFSSRGCGGCHPDPHKSTLGLTCTRCHNEMSWRPDDLIVKHASAGFPLTGAHLGTLCERCHVRAPLGDYQGASILCFNCHQQDFTNAPNHVSFNFPRTCNDCHNTASFANARFNHAFLGNINACYNCHSADYQRASPDHVSFNFPKTCGDCHNTNTFANASFTHSFLGPSPVCYSCHAIDYQNAKNPDHVAGHYATTCGDCHHSFNAW